jgi:arginine/lysine/ornithine decarboxylase
MTGSGDTEESLDLFADALISIDTKTEKCVKKKQKNIYALPKVKMPLYAAAEKEVYAVSVKNAQGCICGEFVWAYPPGIPILIPGEEISLSAAKMLTESSSHMHSDYGRLPEEIMIIKDLEKK